MASILPSISVVCVLIIYLSVLADGSSGAGVNYGLLGDNLPPPSQVIQLLKSRNIWRIRLFSPDANVLNALQNSGIEVIIGTFNQDIPSLGDINFAKSWVQSKIVPYAQTVKIRCIAVGNEVIPGGMTNAVFPAIRNMNEALRSFGLGQIPVSTAIPMNSLASSSPPSSGDFRGDVKAAMQQIGGFLASNNFPLLVTVYPYFAYASDPDHIPLPYVLFTSPSDVVRDGNLGYKNMLDAMVDAVYSALEKVGAGGVEVVVAESGWPSLGNGNITTAALAQTYNQNLVRHVLASGTPKRPNKKMEAYVFALFNENQKEPGVEQNFGLFYPDMREVYHVHF